MKVHNFLQLLNNHTDKSENGLYSSIDYGYWHKIQMLIKMIQLPFNIALDYCMLVLNCNKFNNSFIIVNTIDNIQFLSNSILAYHKICLYYIQQSDTMDSFKDIYRSIQLHFQYFLSNYMQFLNYYMLNKSLGLL